MTDFAAERTEGDVFGPETFALGMPRGRLGRGVPREAARETDSATGRPKGDVFGPETFALGAFRGRSVHVMSREAARETDSANSPSAFQK